ncbi:hypothetical protein AAG570_011058 [Ranatra chinensis]|uniref:Uncharacterized protein n=1 Tax=Ranatra chinensis TaxID=642074 RepID=A0ABD0YJI8_9HEMI
MVALSEGVLGGGPVASQEAHTLTPDVPFHKSLSSRGKGRIIMSTLTGHEDLVEKKHRVSLPLANEENAWRGMFRANLIDVFRQLRESNPESTEKRVSPADGCTASCSSVKSSAVETPDEVQNSDIAEKCENETGEASSRPEEGPSTEDGRERTETVCNAGEKMGDCCKKLMKEGQSFCCNQCGKHWHSCLQSTGYHRCRRDGGEPEKENRPGVIQTPHVESDKPNDRLPESDHATENRSGINKSSISLDTESVSKQFSSMEGLTSSTATSSEVETTCTQLSYFSGTGYDSAISKEELKPGGLRGDVRCNPPRTLPRGSKSLCATRAKSMTICESGVEENYCSMENRNVITVSTISLPPSVRGHPATTKVVIAGRHWRSVYKAYFNYFVREIERQHEDGNRPSGQLLNTLHLQKKVSLAIIDSIVDQTLGCLTFSNKFPNI